MNRRNVVKLLAVLLVAVGVAAVLGIGQAQAGLDLAGYTWSD